MNIKLFNKSSLTEYVFKLMNKAMYFKSVLCVFLISLIVDKVVSHGKLLEPPSRTSAWRSNAGFPINYNDNEMNCGGVNVQWNLNGGRCGICGEASYNKFSCFFLNNSI